MLGSEIKTKLNLEVEVRPYFKGIFAFNEIPTKLKKHCFIIINKDTISERGSHWFSVANYRDEIEIFDSLGTNAEFAFSNFSHLGPHVNFNGEQFQPNSSVLCAKYAIYFCVNRVLNPEVSFENLLEEIFVTEDLNRNEEIVQRYFELGEFFEK